MGRVADQADLFSSAHDAAVQRRDDGIARAIAHADLEVPSWRQTAGEFLERFARDVWGPFLAEDVVQQARGRLPDPPDGRAWGAVFQDARRAGKIRAIGYAPSKSSNLSPKVLWESVG